MKLYKKPEESRRYVEVSESEKLFAAAEVLHSKGMNDIAAGLEGMASMLRAVENGVAERATRTLASQEKNPL